MGKLRHGSEGSRGIDPVARERRSGRRALHGDRQAVQPWGARRPGRGVPLDRERASALLFRRRTIASVLRWLERLGVPARDRRDVSQEVFLAAHQSFHTYNPLLARPERWLNRITVHVASHYRERALHRREELTADDPLDVVDEGPGPDQQLDGEQSRVLVTALLQELDVDLRAVLVAYEIDGVPMT